jgi:hypothetical protein
MKPFFLVIAILVALVMFTQDFGGGPKPGETVTPALTHSLNWVAGGQVHLLARLQATDSNSGKPRNLGFQNIPANVHPEVTCTFADRYGETITTSETTLTHRC